MPGVAVRGSFILVFSTFVLLGTMAPKKAAAYEYLEHSYFADRACLAAQERLAGRIQKNPDDASLASRYLALAVMCPNQWNKPYCKDDYKLLEANINRLPEAPEEGGDLAITLGDMAALPDHVSRFGPVRNLSGAEDKGLLSNVLEWIAGEPDGAGGIIADVSEDACETDDQVPWETVESDIAGQLAIQEQKQSLPLLPANMLAPLARAKVARGPSDPTAGYSIDNPHYLDLVVRSNNHFGIPAYSAWLGFHGTAVDISSRACEHTLGLTADALEDLAEGLAAYEDLDWDELSSQDRKVKGCEVLSERIRRRLLEWGRRAPDRFVTPMAPFLQQLAVTAPVAGLSEVVRAQLDSTVTAVMGLVFEGSGLHYLQDGLSAGHMRTIQLRGLGETRYDHDFDNREGVVALLQTAKGEHIFIAHGDSYLLGPTVSTSAECSQPATVDNLGRVTTCLIRHQRGLLVSLAEASLVDWALSGYMYGKENGPLPCATPDKDELFLCHNLPLAAIRIPGQELSGHKKEPRLQPSVMPLPPPPFAYESLAINVGTEVGGASNLFGLDMSFYDTLGKSSGWLTNYRIGFRTTQGEAERNQFVGDFSYGFHWRWAARVLLDLEPIAYGGVRGAGGNRSGFAGLGTRTGITVLPEGWVKIPLEISLSHRMPVTILTSDKGFFGSDSGVDGHWFQFSLGLAFM